MRTPSAPLRLDPRLVEKPWGGRRLARYGRHLPGDALIGESWDVADLDSATTEVAEPWSRVADGPAAGSTLRELIAADSEGLLGLSRALAGRFPLLVKTLDAHQYLSVQVHPPAAYAAQDPAARFKTETWIVLDAEPGAVLFIGLWPGVTHKDVAAAAGSPGLMDLLQCVPARPGAVHHLPAGMLHALGAGVTVAEVQTPSDTTFRLYDWTERYQRVPRALHVDEALRVLALAGDVNYSIAGRAPRRTGTDANPIEANDHYLIYRHDVPAGRSVVTSGGQARVLYVLDGDVTLTKRGDFLGPGGVRLLPAVWAGHVRASRSSCLLIVVPR